MGFVWLKNEVDLFLSEIKLKGYINKKTIYT